MAGYKFSRETIKELDNSTCLKQYEGPTMRSRAHQVHLAQLPKSNELDDSFPSVSIQDDPPTWKASNPLYGDPEALDHDEDFLENMKSFFQGLVINDDDHEIENMSIFATRAASIQEQL